MTTPQSPLHDADSEKTDEKRRLPRLTLPSEQFRHEASGKIFGVVDLSLGGMAIRVLESVQMEFFPVGGSVEGWLNLRGEKIRISGRVAHLRPGVVGCEFQGLEPDEQTRLEQFLDPSALGKALKPMPAGASGRVRWFHSPGGVELVLEGEGEALNSITLSLLQRVLVWSKEKGVRTGSIEADGLEPGHVAEAVLEMETLEIHYDTRPDEAYLKIAKQFILSSTLEPELQTLLVRKLELT